MMKYAGKKEFKQYAVGIVGIDGDVIRWITVKALSRDDAYEQVDRMYHNDETVMGYQFELEV